MMTMNENKITIESTQSISKNIVAASFGIGCEAMDLATTRIQPFPSQPPERLYPQQPLGPTPHEKLSHSPLVRLPSSSSD